MKKIFAVLSVMLFTACTNPSMEDGLAKMDSALANLAAAIESLNISQMAADIESIDADLAQMVYDLEDANGSWNELISGLNDIHLRLVAINTDNWATKEQMQGLLAQVQQLGEGIDTLVLLADYDYDGVINAIDQCPNTPIMQINNVDSKGCAPDETPETND